MNLITQEVLKSLTPGQSVSGIILVKGYSIQLTKTGKEYIAGELQSGMSVPFKAWGNSGAFKHFKEEAYENVVSFITGTVDGFGGGNTIIIESIQAVDGYTPDQFFPVRYNIDAYMDALKGQIEKRVSKKGQDICDKIFFGNDALIERFKVEFAAMNHHDNCKGGLLAHTYKVINNMVNILATYQAVAVRDGAVSRDYTDLLYIGALLHDIGKVDEMNFGVYQPVSIVTHKFLGIEYIAPYKDDIINAYGELWYYNLISIMLQHHGEYGEPCKTVAAYLVHRADMLDSQLTLLTQAMENVNNAEGSRIRIDDFYLTI